MPSNWNRSKVTPRRRKIRNGFVNVADMPAEYRKRRGSKITRASDPQDCAVAFEHERESVVLHKVQSHDVLVKRARALRIRGGDECDELIALHHLFPL